MKIKDVERANTYIKEIKKLDAEIVNLDKIALLLSNNHVHRIKMEIRYELAHSVAKPVDVFDGHGFIKPEFAKGIERDKLDDIETGPRGVFQFLLHPGGIDMREGPKPEKFERLQADLSEIDFIRILDILLTQKQRERKEYITKLKQLGLEL